MLSNGKPHLLYVVHGQLIAKNKQESTIIKSGSLYNAEGVVMNSAGQDNVYCLSSEAYIMLIDKNILQNSFKPETFKLFLKIVLSDLDKRYIKP